jgi:hypothetical protein
MKRIMAAIFCMFLYANAATATVSVLINGGATGTYQVTSGSTGAVVIVNAYGNPSGVVTVQASGTNEAIQSITVVPQTNPPYSASQLSLILNVNGVSGGSVGNLGGISRNGTNGDLVIGTVTVNGNVGDPSNPNSTSIVGQAINTITAGGDIAASIQATGSSQFNGNITTVESTSGRILGDITAADIIATRIKAASTIGTASHTVNIGGGTYCKLIQGTSIYANINDGVPVSGVYGPMGQLAQLVTTSDGFHGSIKAASIRGAPSGANSLDIASDLDADITLTGDVGAPVSVSRNFISGRMLKISGGVINSGSDNGSLHFGSGGLKGQVIINTAAGSSGWGGAASVDNITLSTLPYYSQSSSGLGGGAVGLAPFHLYESDCIPPNAQGTTTATRDTATVLMTDFSSDTATPVTIRCYGPIARSAGASTWADCVRVYAVDEGGCTGHMDVTDLEFYVRGPGVSDPYITGNREIRLSRKSGVIPKAGLYAVTPYNGAKAVVCDQVAGSPRVVWPTSTPFGGPCAARTADRPHCSVFHAAPPAA